MSDIEVSFHLVAPADEVFAVLIRPQPLANWWRDLCDLHQIRPARDADGRGTTWRAKFRGGPTGRLVEIEAVDVAPGTSVTWALRGDLSGVIAWEVQPIGSITSVRAVWSVSGGGITLLRARRDIAVLRRAGEGLARHLRAGPVEQPTFRGRRGRTVSAQVR